MANARTVFYVAEKPSIAQYVVQAWKKDHPEDQFKVFFAMSPGAARPLLPRSLPISSVPRIEEISLHYDKKANEINENWRNRSKHGYQMFSDVKRDMENADLVLFSCEDAQTTRNFFNVLSVFNVDTSVVKIAAFDFWIRLEDLADQLRDLTDVDDPVVTRRKNYGDARYHFHYNYTINALPVFGPLLRKVGAPREMNFISKNGLQLLLHLVKNSTNPMTFGELLEFMDSGMGRTKYANNEIGSCMSRVSIFEQLIELELLEGNADDDRSRELFKPSSKGIEFASLIHKDVRDPDQAGRLDQWAKNWPESKPAMEKYIRTFFGKQKRFMSKAR